jgi:hypothetical protein
MRTAFICVTVTVTSPLERIYISAGVTRRPFGFQPKGWCLSRSRNGSAHFRRYFTMGKIRGTPCMRSHICVHRATIKYFSNSFIFKTEIEKEGLPADITPWAQEVPGSNPGAPTILRFLPFQRSGRTAFCYVGTRFTPSVAQFKSTDFSSWPRSAPRSRSHPAHRSRHLRITDWHYWSC